MTTVLTTVYTTLQKCIHHFHGVALRFVGGMGVELERQRTQTEAVAVDMDRGNALCNPWTIEACFFPPPYAGRRVFHVALFLLRAEGQMYRSL